MSNLPPDVIMTLRLLLAAVLGGAIGYQRERAGKPAGFRTHMIISMGSALFTVVSIFGFTGPADPSRIAAGVVTGIGFLGAGAIIYHSRKDMVTGLTTAATVWAAAGIGLAAGTGLYIESIVVTALVLAALLIRHFK